MKIAQTFGTLAMVALLATGQNALAGGARSHGQGAPDHTGMQALGIDISSAGNGPEGAREFLGRLSHERQRGLVNGCRATLASPYFAAYYVLSFCQNLVSVTQNFPKAVPPPR
jgi:hypothetical protein